MSTPEQDSNEELDLDGESVVQESEIEAGLQDSGSAPVDGPTEEVPTAPVSATVPVFASPAPAPSSPMTAAEMASLAVIAAIAMVSLGLMRMAQSKASGVIAELGEAMAMAGDWIGWVFLFGYGWILILSFTAFRSARTAGQVPAQVGLLARNGLSIDAAIARADDAKGALVGACRNGAARAANFQVLLGMLLTALWLASKARVFVDAGGMLSSASGGMGRIVSELLQLGPEAFVTTSTALATAVVLSAQGMALAAMVRWLVPSDERLLEEWKRSHEAWLEAAKGAQTARTEELVAQAVSTSQVEALQQSFKVSMQAVGELLGDVRSSLATLQDTASLMGQSYEKLERVTDALETAQLNVTGVAESIGGLTKKVEGYGAGLLDGTKDFTAQLVEDTSKRIPEVVSRATLTTVKSMEPHLRSLTHKMHEDLERSAESIERQYTRAFRDNLQKANDSLMHVNRMSGELEDRAARLAQTVGETAGSWKRSMETVGALHQRLDEVAQRSQEQLQQSIQAQTALTEASKGTAQMIRELSGLVREARGEVSSIRQDAELLGRIREATYRGGRQ